MLKNQPSAHPFVRPKYTGQKKSISGGYRIVNKIVHRGSHLSREHLNNAITAPADDPAAVAAPHGAGDPLAPHRSVTGHLLGAVPLLQVPEPQARVVASGNQLPSVRGEREGGNGGRVGQHGIGTLACANVSISSSIMSGHITCTYHCWHQTGECACPRIR